MATATVSAKGWVVIPKDIREKYGLTKGKRVIFVDHGGMVTLMPALDDPIREMAGMFKGGPSMAEALVEERRRDAERENRYPPARGD